VTSSPYSDFRLAAGFRLLFVSLLLTLLAACSQSAADPDPELSGAAIYTSSCSGCHQADGTGSPGFAPPLAGHAALLASLEGGRRLLVDVIVHGLSGPITVNGVDYDAAMPARPLTDPEVAAVIGYILSAWGNDALLPQGFVPVTAAEAAASRAEQLTPGQVHERRGQVVPSQQQFPAAGVRAARSR
jgi:mono/diheme cytochrome c family protein